MDSQHKVLFYGNSLVLAGVQATFKGCPGFETIAVDQPTTQTELLVLNPNVVVFDLSAFKSEALLTQMQALPGLLLIGVDPESHEVLLTGQAVSSITLDQLTRILRDFLGSRVALPVSPPAKGA